MNATQPRAWSPREVQALGAFAIVTAELVRTALELANNQLEVGQLRQALASRVWIEQAKGVVATQGVTLDQAFHQLRRRARASSRKLAALAQEVVQDVQRERVAAKALDDARSGRLRRVLGRPSRRCSRPTVRDHRQLPVAVISVAGPAYQLRPQADGTGRLVAVTAAAISRRLGHG